MPRLTGNQDPAEGSRETVNHELARQDKMDRKRGNKVRPKQSPKNPPSPKASRGR
jgi:hypothetical protein